ncbi:MAG: hypothetical protein U0230_23495 [Polyangiales bacterium]
MEPVVVRPSRVVSAVLGGFGLVGLGLAAGFVARGGALLVVAVVLGAVCALMVFAAVATLVPGWVLLRIDDDGVSVKRGRTLSAYRWVDIERFGIAPAGRNTWMVALRLRPGHPQKSADAAADFDATLGAGWALDCTELRALLEERHRLALADDR